MTQFAMIVSNGIQRRDHKFDFNILKYYWDVFVLILLKLFP